MWITRRLSEHLYFRSCFCPQSAVTTQIVLVTLGGFLWLRKLVIEIRPLETDHSLLHNLLYLTSRVKWTTDLFGRTNPLATPFAQQSFTAATAPNLRPIAALLSHSLTHSLTLWHSAIGISACVKLKSHGLTVAQTFAPMISLKRGQCYQNTMNTLTTFPDITWAFFCFLGKFSFLKWIARSRDAAMVERRFGRNVIWIWLARSTGAFVFYLSLSLSLCHITIRSLKTLKMGTQIEIVREIRELRIPST